MSGGWNEDRGQEREPRPMPERDADPRDDRTGWERGREPAMCRICAVRPQITMGQCAYCLHGVKP